jgi:hypothetical protein
MSAKYHSYNDRKLTSFGIKNPMDDIKFYEYNKLNKTKHGDVNRSFCDEQNLVKSSQGWVHPIRTNKIKHGDVNEMVYDNKKTENKPMPAKKFRAGTVCATVWHNIYKKDDKEFSFYTTSLEVSYKDKNDEWQKSNNLTQDQISKAILVMSKAYEFISLTAEE